MPTPNYVSCMHCGKDFVPAHRGETCFCSDDCRDREIESMTQDALRSLSRNGWQRLSDEPEEER